MQEPRLQRDRGRPGRRRPGGRSPDADADAAPVPRPQRARGPAAQARVGVGDLAAGPGGAGARIGYLDLIGVLGPAVWGTNRPGQPGLALADPQRVPVVLDAHLPDLHPRSAARVLAGRPHPLTAPLARPLITR